MNISSVLKSKIVRKKVLILVIIALGCSVFAALGYRAKAATPDYTVTNVAPGALSCPRAPYNTELKFNSNLFCASIGWVYSKATIEQRRLFIGDSITVGMYNQWRIDPRYDSVIAISGANVGDIYTALNQLNNKGLGGQKLTHNQVIVMLGTNSYESKDEARMNIEAYYMVFLSTLASQDFCVIVPPVYSSSSSALQAYRRNQLISRLNYWGGYNGFKISTGVNPKMKVVQMPDSGTSPDGGKHSFKKSTAVYGIGVSSSCK